MGDMVIDHEPSIKKLLRSSIIVIFSRLQPIDEPTGLEPVVVLSFVRSE